jgi:hypothetical protein
MRAMMYLQTRPPPIWKTSDVQLHEKLKTMFHLPREEACAALGCSGTTFKQRCRDFGISRWPARSIKSVKKHRAKLESLLCIAEAGMNKEDAEIIARYVVDENIRRYPMIAPNKFGVPSV